MSFDPPPHASRHCRHYSYDRTARPRPDAAGGSKCAAGIDLSAPAACNACMPPEANRTKAECAWREEYTEEERAARQKWLEERKERMFKIMQMIPGNSLDRKNRPEWGKSGAFDCPVCNGGKVHWARARSNGHIHARCSTPGCFSVIQ